MDFRKEFEAYEREHPYREFPVQGGRFRYILSGESGKPAIVFLNGLDMQEAWLRYMIAFERDYRVLMMEYPLACATTDALLDAIAALLKELGIERPILVGGSDGGLLAQLFVRRFPGNVGAVGLQFMGCKVSDITLTGENRLAGMQGIGGIVGTGFDLISGCSATADITAMGNDGACAGLIAGGTTMSSIKNCQAIGGSITAEGNAAWGFGALCGAPWGAPEIRECAASDTVIRATGEGNRLVGGLLGFAGTYDPENPAQIVGCKVENVTLEVSAATDSVGGLVGAGKEMMEGSDVMSSFAICDCAVSGTITGGGEHVGAVVGDPACAVSIACEGGMRIE